MSHKVFASSTTPRAVNCDSQNLIMQTTLTNTIVVRPGVLFTSEKEILLTDKHISAQDERFGITRDLRGNYSCTNKNTDSPIELPHAIYLGTGVDHMYFESLLYTLAKISFLYKNCLRTPKYFILHDTLSFRTRCWVQKILNNLFPASFIVFASQNAYISCRVLEVLSIDAELLLTNLSDIRSMISSLPGQELIDLNAAPMRLFLLRKKSLVYNIRSRRPTNNKVLAFIAKLYGYRVIDPANLELEEVIGLFRNATTVVSYHGGSLANIIFCKPGTKIREIHSGWYDECFEKIALAFELNYEKYRFESTTRLDFPLLIFFLIKGRLGNRPTWEKWRIPYRDIPLILR